MYGSELNEHIDYQFQEKEEKNTFYENSHAFAIPNYMITHYTFCEPDGNAFNCRNRHTTSN